MKDRKIQKKLEKMHIAFYRLYNEVKYSDRKFSEYEKLLFLINRADEATVSAFHEISRIEEEKDGNDSF